MRKLDYTTIFFAIMGSFLFLFILVPILNLMVSADPGSILNNLQDKEVMSAIFISASFVVNSAREGFESVDPRMEKVARTLGSGSFKTFFIITLPLAVRSIVVGSIMCWARAISEFGAIIIIAYFPTTAPVLIYRRFVDFGLSEATPVAVILISLCLLLFLVVRLIMKGWRTYDKN